MTRLDVLEMIGDVITEIDLARGSLLPDDPNRHQLDDLRILLDDRQRKLSQTTFDESKHQFQDAAQKLQSINSQIQGTIQHVGDIVTVLNNIKDFLAAATTLITALA